MRPALGDAPLIENQNLIRIDDGRKPMRDDERGAALGHALKRILDFALGETVERRGRLVEHQDRRRLEDRAGDGDALLLAAREFQPALADLRVIAVGQRFR